MKKERDILLSVFERRRGTGGVCMNSPEDVVDGVRNKKLINNKIIL